MNVAGERFNPGKDISKQIRLGHPRDALTASTSANIFTFHLCLLRTLSGITARLRLECITGIIDAVLSQNRVHAALQGVALPAKEVVSMLTVNQCCIHLG